MDDDLHPLEAAFALTAADDGSLSAMMHGDFSNGPISMPATVGAPFGGLLAALSADAMRRGLGLTIPLRTLSVQYLAAAGYDRPLHFQPRLLRGGRTVSFSAADAVQDGRLTHHATATWGGDQPGAVIPPLLAPPSPRGELDPARGVGGPMSPHFARYVDYVFETRSHILGGNEGRPAVERVWMRMKHRPLDELSLCYLLDALYPPSWTAFKRPPPMTTIDLRYDLFEAITPDTAPDGWLFFEFRLLALDNGWTVDDAVAWTADGRPVAVSRQRRKLLPERRERPPA